MQGLSDVHKRYISHTIIVGAMLCIRMLGNI